MNKHLSFVLAVALLTTLGWSSSPVSVEAATKKTCAPTLSTTDVKKTSVKLKITCPDWKKDKVSIKVFIENTDADTDSTKTVSAKLGKTGSVTIKMGGLDSATPYKFKVKVKKGSDKFSAYSSEVTATTEGSDYDVAITKINGISDDSVKLNIQSTDLENKKVNVIAAYKRKKDWDTKTFTVTLDDDGKGDFTLDGLKSKTEYSFKVKIQKDGESGYTPYSEIKNATTDDN